MAVTINASTSAGLVQTADTSGVLQLQTAGTTAVTVNAAGLVGIGTTNPDGDLQIYKNAATSLIRMTSSTTGVAGIDFGDTAAVDRGQVRYFNNGDYLLFATDASERMRITSTGNVGIGTTNPGVKLDVNGQRIKIQNASDPGIEFWNASTVQGYVFYDTTNNFMTMRHSTTSTGVGVDSSGHVYIGTTNSAPRDFTSGGGCVIKPPANTFEFASSDTNPVFLNYTGSASGSATFITFRQQGAGRGSISTNGSTTAYNTSSDYRLKENIAPMTGALNKVAQLKPVTFTWKETGNQSQGFIAHELAEVVPDCVTGAKDAVDTYIDKDGIEQTKIKPPGVDTSFLVATLTAAIQEQQTIINDLKARITALEGAA